MRLRVVGAQIPVSDDIETNRRTICRAIEFAAAEKADILLTPEGSLSGYTHQFDSVQLEDALADVTDRARRAGLGLALGTCFVEPGDGRCYNQVRFYDSAGDYLGFHSKALTCGTLDDPPRGEIEHFAISPLRTFAFAGITVGALICNDLWANPGCTPQPDTHLTQQLARMRARIVFHAVNGGRDGSEGSRLAWQYHEANLRMRAAAGRLWIVTVDNCLPLHLPCSAPSRIVGPDGVWVTRVPESGERFFAHTIEIDLSRV